MQAETLERPEAIQIQQRKRSILVVDDDESIVETLVFRLDRQGYKTHSAYSGKKALSLARELHPDLVLLDLRLPDVDGFSVCRELDEDPATCHIPIIILSGMERPDIIRRSRVAGCTYFVRKPYDPNALLILIQQAIHGGNDF